MKQEKVTVFRTGYLGDTVCAIPAFRLLREHFRGAHLTLLCDRANPGNIQGSDVVGPLGIFDDVVEYRNRRREGLAEITRFLQRSRPDTIVLLTQRNETLRQSWRRRLFFRLWGVRTVLSVPPLRRTSVVINEPTRLVHGLNRLGIAGDAPPYSIDVDVAAADTIRRELAGLGVDPLEPYVVFCGGGKAPTQRWELSRYAEVIADIGRDASMPVVGIGNADEIEHYRNALLPMCPGLRLISADLSFPALCELLRGAYMYLGNDTGPMHVAAALGCPTVVVMSARNTLGAWDPDIHPALVIRHTVPCQGCFLTECTQFAHRCMTEITAERVSNDVRTFMRRLPRDRWRRRIRASIAVPA